MKKKETEKKLVKEIKKKMTEAEALQIKECSELEKKYPTTGMAVITVKQRLSISSMEYIMQGNITRQSVIYQLKAVIKRLEKQR